MDPRLDIDPARLADIASPGRGAYLSGYYYQAALGSGLSTSATLSNGVLRATKVRIVQRVKITRLGVRITSAGDTGSTLRLAVFADGRIPSTNPPGYPGLLLLDAGGVAADAIASPEATVALTLDPGLYFFGAAVQGVTTTQPTVETIAGPLVHADPLPLGTAAPTTTAVPTLGFTYSGVTGAVPANFTPTVNLSSAMPRIYFKVA